MQCISTSSYGMHRNLRCVLCLPNQSFECKSHTSMIFKEKGTKTVTKSSRNTSIMELRLVVGPDLQLCQCSSGCFTSCCSQMGALFFSGVQLFRAKEALWLPPAATYAWRTALEHGSAEQSAGSSAFCRLERFIHIPRVPSEESWACGRGEGLDLSTVCLPHRELEINRVCLVLEHLG